MSALLSPPRPVRTRFKVPGEGSYELCADLPPPPSPVYPPPTPPPTKPSPPANLQSPPPAAPPFIAGPLGLAKVTKLSFAERTTLAPPPPDASPTDAAPPGSPLASASSMFSFRKLTGLGSSLSAKFSSSTEDDPAQHVSSATQSPRADDGPRFPPRVATARREGRWRPDDAPPPHPGGVLAYNASESVVVVDMQLSEDLPNAEPALTLQSRSPPSAQSLHRVGEAVKLLVGCVNGEVLHYPDIVSAGAEASKKSRTVSAVATLASVAGVINGGSSPAVPQHFVYNKEGATNSTRVIAVTWVPNSAFRFMSVHDDGAVVVYDSRFKPSPGSLRATVSGSANAVQAQGGGAQGGSLAVMTPSFDNTAEGANSGTSIVGGQGKGSERGSDKGGDKESGDKDRERSGLSSGSGDKAAPSGGGHKRSGSTVAVSGAGVVGQHDILVTKLAKGKRSNPVAVWQVGKATVTACEFCPVANGDSRLLAMTGRDGYLRIIDFTKEIPLLAFRSYFGAFLCVSWSPDGKYVATGGEDDLVSIWCPGEEKLVARLEGHTSWVSAVAWDGCLSGPGRYRIGSAGQDAKLLLWDFALDVLHHRSPPPRVGTGMVRLRSYARDAGETASSNGGTGTLDRKASKLSRLRAHASGGSGGADGDSGSGASVPVSTGRVVAAPGRAEVPIVEPVVAHVAHGEPLTDVWFQEGGVFTADAGGTVKMWSRPAAHAVPELSLLSLEGGRRAGADLD